MRIGIDARFLGEKTSGLARYSENLLEAMARADTHNDYVVFVSRKLQRKLKLRPNFKLVPMRGHPLGLTAMIRMILAVRREKIDLLHVHFPASPPFIECPVLITVHDIVPFARESAVTGYRLRPWRRLWSYILYTMTLTRARWVTCVSSATREALCRLYPELRHKTIVVHSGVDEIFRTPIEATTFELIRSRLELPKRYMLYSGSIRAEKNIAALLRVFATIRQHHAAMEDLWLVMEISGAEHELEALSRMARQYGIADRLQVVTDAKDDERRVIFEDARLLILLSRAEGFGFPILEAQLSGLPVIAADAGALPEIAGEDGAVLVDPEDQDSVIHLIERVLTDESLRRYLIDRGRANAADYSWNESARQLTQIYDFLFYPRDQVELPPRNKLVTLVSQWLRL